MAAELKVQLRQVAASTTEAAMRGHQVRIDRPEAKGGADLGPMGGELFLASVGGCFLSNLLAAVRARGLDVAGVRAEVTGTLAESPARFSGIDVLVSAENADPETLGHLVEIADRACIMMNTLRGTLAVTLRVAGAASAAV